MEEDHTVTSNDIAHSGQDLNNNNQIKSEENPFNDENEESKTNQTNNENHDESEIKPENNENQDINNNGDDEDFGDFEESHIDNTTKKEEAIEIVDKKEINLEEEIKTNELSKKEPPVQPFFLNNEILFKALTERNNQEIYSFLQNLNHAIFAKENVLCSEILCKENKDSNIEAPEKSLFKKNFEKVPERVSANFKETFANFAKKPTSKKKMPASFKVPIDQDDKQFSLKIIEDLNKVWENLGCKRILKEKTKIKSPDYDFFLEELTKADFKKDNKASKDKLKNGKFLILLNQKEGKTNFEGEPDLRDDVLPQNLLENLNKPLFNYDYSAILNQNFTENFKLRNPLEKKAILKKALSSVLEENNSLNLDTYKTMENKPQQPMTAMIQSKKNSLNSPKIERKNSENLTNSALKKLSIDGMTAFGFELDMDANEKVEKKANNVGVRKESLNLKNEDKDNGQEIKNILPDYEDIFN